MAKLPTDFNVQDQDAFGFDPLPAGDYIAAMTDSEWRTARSGNGRYLACEFQILEGDHKGRFIWSNLNLENKNELAVKIARSELAAICRAVGKSDGVSDSLDLHDLPIRITVKVTKRKDTGDLTNRISSYKKVQESTSEEPSEAPPSQPDQEDAPWG